MMIDLWFIATGIIAIILTWFTYRWGYLTGSIKGYQSGVTNGCQMVLTALERKGVIAYELSPTNEEYLIIKPGTKTWDQGISPINLGEIDT